MRIGVRIILLPLMSVFELLLLVVCFFTAFINPTVGIAINEWSRKLPEIEWYLYKD